MAMIPLDRISGAAKTLAQQTIDPTVYFPGTSPTGTEIELRRDPIMVRASKWGDEREYVEMFRSCLPIQIGLKQRRDGALSKPYKVKPGTSNSRQAQLLRDVVEGSLDSLPGQAWMPWLCELHESLIFGWRPTNVTWSRDLRVGGRTWWRPRMVMALPPWEFDQTVPLDDHGTRGLVLRRALGVRQQELEWVDPERLWSWLLTRSGATADPYGRSLLADLWLPWKQLDANRQAVADMAPAALGKLRVRETRPGGLPRDEAQLAKLVAEVHEHFHRHGVLVQRDGVEVDWVTNPTGLQHGETMVRGDAKAMTTALLSQNLTSDVAEGSFAAAKTHLAVLAQVVKADAAIVGAWLTDFAAMIVDANATDVEPEDYPWVASQLLNEIDAEALRFLLEHGARVRADEVSEAWSLPEVVQDGSEPVLLSRPTKETQRPVDPFEMPAESVRSIPEADPVDQVHERLKAAAEQDMQAVMASLLQAVLERSPDPKAPPP